MLLAAAAVGACVYFYPKWRAAGLLQKGLTSGFFSYELEVVLDRGAMEAGQAEVLEKLARLTGFEEDALFCFTVKGSVWEDRIHALFYPKDSNEPLMELYLSSDIDVINETLPYNTIRRNLTERYGLLDYIMPAERDAVYMTLEQAERIFGLDLEGLRGFALPEPEEGISRVKCFLLLLAMSEGKGGKGGSYEIQREGAGLRLELPEESAGTVTLRLEAQELRQALSWGEKLFARLKIELPEQLELLEGISGTIVLGEGEEIRMPDRLMDQKTADRLIGIRDVVNGIREIFVP